MLIEAGRLDAQRVTVVNSNRRARVFDLSIASAHHNFIASGFVVHNKTPPFRVPAAIEDLVITDPTESSLTLMWSTPDGDDGAPSTYLITTDLGQEATYSVTPKQPGAPESYVLTGLSPNTTYQVTVHSSYGTPALSSPAVTQGNTR